MQRFPSTRLQADSTSVDLRCSVSTYTPLKLHQCLNMAVLPLPKSQWASDPAINRCIYNGLCCCVGMRVVVNGESLECTRTREGAGIHTITVSFCSELGEAVIKVSAFSALVHGPLPPPKGAAQLQTNGRLNTKRDCTLPGLL